MTKSNQVTPARPDRVSLILLVVPVAVALGLILLFYLPGIHRAVTANELPKEVLSLKLHIAAYCLSYSLFVAGLLLTIKGLVTRTMIPGPWIEAVTVTATLLAFLGLFFGLPASESIWEGFLIWDIKVISAIFATFAFTGISIAVLMTRFIPGEKSRNVSLLFLFAIEVVLCTALFLIGRVYGLTIHPQWFPEVLFQ